MKKAIAMNGREEQMDDLISRQAAIDKFKILLSRREYVRCTDEAKERVASGFFADIPSAKQWTPCSERVPEDEYVLISKKLSKISGDKWCVAIAIRMTDPRSGKVNWRDTGFGVIQDDKVLAWMPLPEPYEP